MIRLSEGVRVVAILLFGLIVAAHAVAAPPSGNDLVKARLIADVKSVKAGQPFTLGVLLKIDPGWHVYWKNPGESGMATSVAFKVPEGFKVGKLNFPIPRQFGNSGDVIGYGYEDDVLLTATVTPPNDLGPEKGQPFAADVAWLVCEKMCLPGKGSVSLDLPLGDIEPEPANGEIFNAWKDRFPHAKLAGSGSESHGSAFAKFSEPVKGVHWFPVPPAQSGVENIQTKTDGDVSTITFELVPAPKEAAPMSFLVVWTNEDQKQQGAEFTVNLPPADKK